VITEVKLKRRMSIIQGVLSEEIYNTTFFEKGYDHTLLASLQLPEHFTKPNTPSSRILDMLQARQKEILRQYAPTKKMNDLHLATQGKDLISAESLRNEITDANDRLTILSLLAFHPTKPLDLIKNKKEEHCSITVCLTYNKPTILLH